MHFSKYLAIILLLCAGTVFGQSRPEIAALAQSIYGKGSTVEEMDLSLKDSDIAELHKANGAKHYWEKVQFFRVVKAGKSAGVLLVDNVKGKSRPITYAVAFDQDGSILSLEILTYRESHGGEVQSETFRRQFVGRKHGDPIAIGSDIRNISGATISSRSVTRGAHALATLYQYLKAHGKRE